MKIFSLLLTFMMSLPVMSALEKKFNGEYVTISGTVTDVNPHSFILKAKNDKVLVEMDDHDWDADGYKLMENDNVVVSGMVDADYLEAKKIEAGSVYVKSLDTYFYASSDDEEDIHYHYMTTALSRLSSLPEGTLVDAQGTVTAINGREMTINTGLRKIVVDTDDMLYDPLDDKGFTQIDVGDYVRTSGNVDKSFFEANEIDADYVTEM